MNVTSGNTTSSTVAIPVGSLAVTVTVAGSPVGGAAVTVTLSRRIQRHGHDRELRPIARDRHAHEHPGRLGLLDLRHEQRRNRDDDRGRRDLRDTTAATVVIPTGSIAVTVKNQSGTSLNGASLTLTGPGSYSATGSTGSGSTYTFPNVPINATGYTVTATLGAGTGSTPGVVVSATSPEAATVTIKTDRSGT